MVQRVATDERPFEKSSDESGLGRSDSPSEDTEPEAALVVPPDGGWGWVVVAASFMCNAVVDGIISGGQMKTEVITEFNAKEADVAFLYSLLSGFYLLAGPFVSALANKYGFRIVTIAGSIVSAAAFSLSYYVTSLSQMYLLYGVIGGIGLSMIYLPSVLTVGFYFEKWRALATGLALCGSGVGMFCMKQITDKLLEFCKDRSVSWRFAFVAQGGMILLCTLFGAMYRPLKPVRVTLDEADGDETARRHEEAVEKLNSMLKLNSKLDSGISMPPEMRFNKASPHTWMGVPNNTRYPTAEEVFRGSNSHLTNQIGRRSSANAGAIKNTLGNKPLFIDVPVVEKDEQEDSNGNIDNTEPLISTPTQIKIVTTQSHHAYRRSHADLVARPLYRDDIFFGASLNRLPQYTSRTSLGYHALVTHVPTKADVQEEQADSKCRFCPEAVVRTLATMLDISLFKSPTFVLFALSGMFSMLGYFVPFLYAVDRVIDEKGWTPTTARFLISTIGIANVIGRVLCGMVSSVPKISTLWVNNIAITAGGIAMMLSSLSNDAVTQYAFSCVFGIACACFASLRSILVVEYLGLEQLTNCFGLFLLFQGVGALLGLPIAGWLYQMTENYGVPFVVSGALFTASALMTYPIDWVSRWEKERAKLNASPKV